MTDLRHRAFRHPAPALQPAHPAVRARPRRAGEIRRRARARDRRRAASARRPRNSWRRGRGHGHDLRRRRRRPHQPAAPDPVRDAGHRRAQGRRGRAAASRRSIPRCASSASRSGSSAAELVAARCAPRTSCSTAATTSRRATRSTRHACAPASRSCPAPRCASTGRSRCSIARDANAPCYHCLFGEGDELEETRCATMGVFAPLVGIVGADAGGRSAQAPRRRRRAAARPPPHRRRARHAHPRAHGAARSRVPGVLGRDERESARARRVVRCRRGSPSRRRPAARRCRQRSGPRSAR